MDNPEPTTPRPADPAVATEPTAAGTDDPAAADPASATGAADPAAASRDAPPDLEERIVEALKTVYDPEIPVNIYELGLIYNLEVQDGGHVDCKMTLTSPACPVAGTLPGEVQAKIEGVDGVTSAAVEVVWDPPWNPGMMSEAAKLELGFMDFV
ncbi:MAG: SUF system Fe-S cluster assembly protein [Acidobacteria bacterium]|nr:MAG: SUF system Fe-S cluster assembly protein [Acidobacteriota bacterium]